MCVVYARRAPVDDVDTENMNPQDIYESFKNVQADIQKLSKLSHSDDVSSAQASGKRDTTSQDSGIQGSLQDVRDGGGGGRGRDSPRTRHHQQQHHHQYNPSHYSDTEVGVLLSVSLCLYIWFKPTHCYTDCSVHRYVLYVLLGTAVFTVGDTFATINIRYGVVCFRPVLTASARRR